jgi:hypothetical protein
LKIAERAWRSQARAYLLGLHFVSCGYCFIYARLCFCFFTFGSCWIVDQRKQEFETSRQLASFEGMSFPITHAPSFVTFIMTSTLSARRAGPEIRHTEPSDSLTAESLFHFKTLEHRL